MSFVSPCRRRGIIAARNMETVNGDEAQQEPQRGAHQDEHGKAQDVEQQAGERHARSEVEGRQEPELLRCAKCGRAIGRGRYMHEKHCKG